MHSLYKVQIRLLVILNKLADTSYKMPKYCSLKLALILRGNGRVNFA